MSGAYQKITAQFNTEKKRTSEVYKFFESLLYGTLRQSPSNACLKHYNFYTNRTSECLIYFHENHIGVMVCVDKSMTGLRAYFNVKNIDISQFNSEYELDRNIEKHKYLVLKEKQDILVLMFEDKDNRNNFKDNLEKLKKIFSPIPDSYDPTILKAFIKADSNQNGEISWAELKNLVRMMKVDLNNQNKGFVKKILGKQKIEIIEFSQFQRLWKIFYCRNELIEVFQKYNREEFHSLDEYLAPKLDIREFKKFLIEEQKQTEQESTLIIKRLYQKDNYSLSFYEFCHYIFGPHNNLLNEDYKNKKIVDRNRPLNNYYCYSSHNTYLTGDQIFSDSRVERYLVDLQNGLRCVEIDVHDGPEGPIVKHGYTPTSSVLFEDVIKSIKRFAVLNPKHTPIILSLEVHCNKENQQKMAEILLEHFQNNIIRTDPDKRFPSFHECEGKIIVKGPGDIKLFTENQLKTNEQLQGQFFEDEEGSNEIESIPFEAESKETSQLSEKYKSKRQEFAKRFVELQKLKKGYFSKKNEFRKVKREPTRIHQALQNKSLKEIKSGSNSTKSLQKQTFHEKYKVSGKLLQLTSMLSKSKLQNPSCWQSSSLSENKLIAVYNDSTKYDQMKYLSYQKWFRSYPDGFRILSSNYDPIPALELGFQIVAINTQSKDDVNHHILKAFFTKGQNINTGYREKAPREKTAKQKVQFKKKLSKMTKVQIKFISGLRIYQNDETETNIPPVEVKAYFTGTKRDNQINEKLLAPKQYTEIVYNQAFNPKFNKIQPIEIKCMDLELGFLIVEVSECGRSVVPMDSMKHGWRVISLYNDELKEKESKILCHIELTKIQIQVNEEE